MVPSNIIANADDFGYDRNITEAIIKAYEQGYVNSISMMTNSDYFDEAITTLKNYPSLKNIGVHINLTLGKPLTNIDKAYLTPTGEWNRSVTYKLFTILDKRSRVAFFNEICSQIERALNAGVNINHLDSHHHVHILPCFAGLFIKVARNYGLKLRLAQTDSSGSILKKLYKLQLNKTIISNNLHYTDHFEYPDKLSDGIGNFAGLKTLELMFHPVLNERGELTDHYNPMSFNAWVKCFPSYYHKTI